MSDTWNTAALPDMEEKDDNSNMNMSIEEESFHRDWDNDDDMNSENYGGESPWDQGRAYKGP